MVVIDGTGANENVEIRRAPAAERSQFPRDPISSIPRFLEPVTVTVVYPRYDPNPFNGVDTRIA